MCNVYGEACFSKKKMFTNGLNMGLTLWAWTEKTVHGIETHWLSCKEKVLGATDSKEYRVESSGTEKDSSLLISLKMVEL